MTEHLDQHPHGKGSNSSKKRQYNSRHGSPPDSSEHDTGNRYRKRKRRFSSPRTEERDWTERAAERQPKTTPRTARQQTTERRQEGNRKRDRRPRGSRPASAAPHAGPRRASARAMSPRTGRRRPSMPSGRPGPRKGTAGRQAATRDGVPASGRAAVRKVRWRQATSATAVGGLGDREDVPVAHALLQRPQQVGAGVVLPVREAFAAADPGERGRPGGRRPVVELFLTG